MAPVIRMAVVSSGFAGTSMSLRQRAVSIRTSLHAGRGKRARNLMLYGLFSVATVLPRIASAITIVAQLLQFSLPCGVRTADVNRLRTCKDYTTDGNLYESVFRRGFDLSLRVSRRMRQAYYENLIGNALQQKAYRGHGQW